MNGDGCEMRKKYTLTEESFKLRDGEVVYRIQATEDIPSRMVKRGDIGGWVGKNATLEDNAWVADEAIVSGEAILKDNAYVRDQAWVGGKACLVDNAKVSDQAVIVDEAMVTGMGKIQQNAMLIENAVVGTESIIRGNVVVGANTMIIGSTLCMGEMFLSEQGLIENEVIHGVEGDIRLRRRNWKQGPQLSEGQIRILAAINFVAALLYIIWFVFE